MSEKEYKEYTTALTEEEVKDLKDYLLFREACIKQALGEAYEFEKELLQNELTKIQRLINIVQRNLPRSLCLKWVP